MISSCWISCCTPDISTWMSSQCLHLHTSKVSLLIIAPQTCFSWSLLLLPQLGRTQSFQLLRPDTLVSISSLLFLSHLTPRSVANPSSSIFKVYTDVKQAPLLTATFLIQATFLFNLHSATGSSQAHVFLPNSLLTHRRSWANLKDALSQEHLHKHYRNKHTKLWHAVSHLPWHPCTEHNINNYTKLPCFFLHTIFLLIYLTVCFSLFAMAEFSVLFTDIFLVPKPPWPIMCTQSMEFEPKCPKNKRVTLPKPLGMIYQQNNQKVTSTEVTLKDVHLSVLVTWTDYLKTASFRLLVSTVTNLVVTKIFSNP
jgi:hypothetical protein